MSIFKLDRGGGSEVLKLLAAEQVNALAAQVAKEAGVHAQLEEYTTDRAAASVSVPAELQARDGVLTRAAAQAGLEVRSK